MMMMGLYFMKDVPFREVYIHALVRDAEGQKMSKSKGNVVDPLEVMDQFGTDAFRFSLAAFAAMGRDVRLSEDRIAGYRNFVNKIWNASRFTLMNLADFDAAAAAADTLPLTVAERWIVSRLQQVSREWPRPSIPIISTRPPIRSTSSPGMSSATGIWSSSSRPCMTARTRPSSCTPKKCSRKS